MDWLTLTLLSALAGSLTRILQKVLLSNKKSDPVAFAFVFQLTVAGIFLVFVLLTQTWELPDLSSV